MIFRMRTVALWSSTSCLNFHTLSRRGLAGIYEVYAFGDIVTGEEYRSVTTGTYINLERLFKNFRQHMNRKADAKDAEEYNALYSLAGRLTRGSGTLREWQNRHGQNEEEALYRPLDHPYHANGQWS